MFLQSINNFSTKNLVPIFKCSIFTVSILDLYWRGGEKLFGFQKKKNGNIYINNDCFFVVIRFKINVETYNIHRILILTLSIFSKYSVGFWAFYSGLKFLMSIFGFMGIQFFGSSKMYEYLTQGPSEVVHKGKKKVDHNT